MKKIDYKWTMLLLISAAYFLAQGTRQIYAAVLPDIKSAFGSDVSDANLGLVGSTFTLAFGIVIPFAGLAADFFRRKWIIVAGALLFSSGIFLSGFAGGLGMLFVAYGLMNGAGQSLLPPCNSSLIGEFHTDTRGTAFSIYQGAIYLGIVVCAVSAGMLAGKSPDGWRMAFWIFGALGMLWTLVLAFFLKDTPNVGKKGEVSVKDALKAFFSKPTALLMMGALGCYFFATYGVKIWTPVFMMRSFPEMPHATAVFHGFFWFYLGAFAGVTLAGRVSDKLKPQRPFVRFEIELAGLLLCIPFILVIAKTSSLPLMISALALFGFSTGIYDSNLYAALLDVIDPKYRAMATGIFGCGGCIIGALGPVVMGLLSDAFSIRTAFASLAIFAIFGSIFIAVSRFGTVKKDII
ncbi:MAG: MFS transporter [Bacteroidales bacterium]|nr:MFS transporter [Bacteroidales bacterium]MBR0301379.1 MFS transporter [Bacteroidales bacterium]